MTDEKLFLGDINARRDWGYAPDFVVGFYHQMQLEEPTELLFATNQTHSVKDILELAFGFIGRRFEEHIYVKQEFIRNDDRNNIQGDYSKANELIGWQPIKKFDDMIVEMVKNDINLLKNA
jgi:GDPmannose 4,6-dehydratase